MRRLALGLLLLPMAAPASDQVRVYGSESCGIWLKHRKEGGPSSTVRETWVMGFISGYTMGTPLVIKSTDTASMYSYIDKYCTKYPLHFTANAAEDLAIALVKK